MRGVNVFSAFPFTLATNVAINKNFRMPWEGHIFAYRLELYNSLNHRNYGIPESRIVPPAFGNEGATAGGIRRIVMGLRYQF